MSLYIGTYVLGYNLIIKVNIYKSCIFDVCDRSTITFIVNYRENPEQKHTNISTSVLLKAEYLRSKCYILMEISVRKSHSSFTKY